MSVARSLILLWVLLLLPLSSLHPTISKAQEIPALDPVPLLERYRQALSVDSDNLTLHYYYGVALLLDGRLPEAIAEFKTAYPAFSGSLEANYNLGIAYSRFGDIDSALVYFEQAEMLGALEQLDLYPLHNALYNLGLLYLERGQSSEALEMFESVLRIVPNRTDIQRLIGETHARDNRDDEAMAAFAAYLKVYPEDAEVKEYLFALYFNLGLKQLERQELEAARTAFEQALEIFPESPLALYQLAYLAYQQQRWANVVSLLEERYPSLPEDLQQGARSILLNTARALLGAGQGDEADRAISPLVEAHAEDAAVLYLAGNIQLHRGLFVEARSLFERVLGLDPAHKGAAVNLVAAASGAAALYLEQGRELFRAGSYVKAAELLEKAREFNPADPQVQAYLEETRRELAGQSDALFTDAGLQFEQERYPQALRLVRQGLELTPKSERGLVLQGRILAALDQELARLFALGNEAASRQHLSAARQAFSAVLALDPRHADALAGLERVTRLERERVDALAAEGMELLEEGRMGEARIAFDAALALQPQHGVALMGLGRLEGLVASLFSEQVKWGRRAVSEGDLATAAGHFRKALGLKENQALRTELERLEEDRRKRLSGILLAAQTALAAEDFSRAGNLFHKALRAEPDDAQAQAAVASFRQVAAAAVEQYLAAAGEAEQAGQIERALSKYRNVLDIEPGNGVALAGLKAGRAATGARVAQLLKSAEQAVEAQELEQAKDLVQQVLAIDPFNKTARAVSEAIASGLRQPGSSPRDLEQLYLEGIELYTQGKYPEAVALWQKLLSLSPGHEKARRNIERTRRRLEKIRERQGG